MGIDLESALPRANHEGDPRKGYLSELAKDERRAGFGRFGQSMLGLDLGWWLDRYQWQRMEWEEQRVESRRRLFKATGRAKVVLTLCAAGVFVFNAAGMFFAATKGDWNLFSAHAGATIWATLFWIREIRG